MGHAPAPAGGAKRIDCRKYPGAATSTRSLQSPCARLFLQVFVVANLNNWPYPPCLIEHLKLSV